MSEHYIDTTHGRLAFTDLGRSDVPVVLIHANSVCKESFETQIAELSRGRRVVAFDLPGHGASDDASDPRRTYSMSGYADALLEALGKMGVQRFVVVGHSLGGHVALEMIAAGAQVDGALIFGTPPVANNPEGLQAGFKPTPEMAYTGNAELLDEQVPMIVELALGAGARDDAFFINAVRRTHGVARQYMIEAAIAGHGSDQRRLAETSLVPLAIVNGQNDPVINLDYIDSLNYANIWEGAPKRVEGAGHALHRERPDEFNAVLLRFIDFVRDSKSVPVEGAVAD
ncbi:alpha/beta hydrolase [Neorhizobium sp. BT27B]|uniref:alpha/beta fold hydrolase n=1 Tax=Neorhizobium sp. BT27B TaxID=3142625 RepID=UPI003D2A99D7